MTSSRFYAGAVLLGCLAGCTVGPNYEPPDTQTRENYAELPQPGVNTDNPVIEWWQLLQDPLLDQLIVRATESNWDLRQAEARVLEARAQRRVIAAELWPFVDANASYTYRGQSLNLFQNNRSSSGGGGLLGGILNRLPSVTFRPGAVDPATGLVGPPSYTVNPPSGGGGGGGGGGLQGGQGGTGAGGTAGLGVRRDTSLYQAGFDATWEIDLWGRIRRQVEAAEANIEASIAERNSLLVTLLSEVARNYVEARGLQRRIQITHDNIRAQAETVELTTARFQAGLTSELDVAQARAQLATTQSQIPLLEQGLRQTMHRLAVLLGQEPGALIDELSAVKPIPSVPPDIPVGLPMELIKRRQDIVQAERLLAAATAQIGAAEAELYPQLNLLGSFGLQSLQSGRLFDASSIFWSVGPGIRWPIFQGGRLRANIEVANAQQAQAMAQYQQVVLNSLEEVENALVAYGREKERWERLRDAVDANRRAFTLSNELYSRGLADFLSVLESQRSLFQSQDQLVQSEQIVTQNLIALYKALGGGWETGLGGVMTVRGTSSQEGSNGRNGEQSQDAPPAGPDARGAAHEPFGT